MSGVQTNYTINTRTGYSGQIADLDYANVIGSAAVETGPILFGTAVQPGTGFDQVINGATALTGQFQATDNAGTTAEILGSTYLYGIALRVLDRENNNAESMQAEVNENVAFMKKGRVWIEVAETITTSSPVYVDATTGVISASDATGRLKVLNAKWETAAASGEVAKLNIFAEQVPVVPDFSAA